MIGVYSILLGAAIVVSALFLLRREFKQAYFIPSKGQEAHDGSINQASLLSSIDGIEAGFTEMSEAFYDISGDLEGKYSVHEKELSLLDERIDTLEQLIKDQAQTIKTLEKQLKVQEKKSQQVVIVEETDPKAETVPNVNEKIDISQQTDDLDQVSIVEEQVVSMPEANDVKGQIITLRSKGYSLKQIAKELNIGLGEIQLILNMKRS